MAPTPYTQIYYDDSAFDYKNQAVKAYGYLSRVPSLVLTYLLSLLPIISWIRRYNLTWFTGDLIAGVTIGCVVVPQGMAYAKLATLPVEYGLYSSFTGVFVYCFFASSKDITIGPVAVMSLLMATILSETPHHGFTNVEIASTLALFAGLIVLLIGLLRLGYIVDFISGPVIAGFMSGSALTIGLSQLPGLFGIPNVNTRQASYLVLGNTLKNLPNTKPDAAFGLVGLAVLYIVRHGSEKFVKKFPKWKRIVFFVNTGRSVLLVVISTIIAFFVARSDPHNSPIKLNGSVPPGLQHIGPAHFNYDILSELGGQLPVVVLVLVLEHIAIAKSFGRLNDYVINPNQEMIAIGVANVLGSLFAAYPVTGSFSRTAIKAKAGVRTPLAGVISGCIVLLALYVLTPAFFYIPNATLCAVIIHAVADLFSGPKTWKQYWHVSPLELLIFITGVVITFFTSVEVAVYVTVGLSLFILLTRIAHPRFSVLGRVVATAKSGDTAIQRHIYVPIDDESVRTNVELDPIPPGVLVVRLEESYTYPNAAYLTDRIIDAAKSKTKHGYILPTRNDDRKWNDDGKEVDGVETLPILKAIVLDFSCVSNFDSTALQSLSMARASLDRYAGHRVQWHFANVADGAIRRALLAGGFGGVTPVVTETEQLPMVPVLNHTQSTSSDGISLDPIQEDETGDDEPRRTSTAAYIHYDLDDAVRAASLA